MTIFLILAKIKLLQICDSYSYSCQKIIDTFFQSITYSRINYCSPSKKMYPNSLFFERLSPTGSFWTNYYIKNSLQWIQKLTIPFDRNLKHSTISWIQCIMFIPVLQEYLYMRPKTNPRNETKVRMPQQVLFEYNFFFKECEHSLV